jgi:hypothetical protein
VGTRLLRTVIVSTFLMKIAGLRCHGKEISPHRSVSLSRLAVALALAGGIGHAQPQCPLLNFQGAPSASLKPSASTHMVVLQQSNGSYTAFELTDASPYRIVRTSPNFQRQFTGCPGFPVAGIYPIGQSPEAFTRLNSGGYLWVKESSVNGTPGALYVAAFDSALNLTSEAQYPVAAGVMAVVDVNGDGIPDILSGVPGRFGSSLQVLIGNGGSSFQPAVGYGITTSLFLTSMSVADLNGDNNLDIVISSSSPAGGKISVFLGNGDGTFQPERAAFSFPGTSWAPATAIADLNGDGKPDLAFTMGDMYPLGPVVQVALGAGDGSFGTPTKYPIGSSDSVAIGDMNGDGFLDIVTSGISILLGDGQGGFPNRVDYWQEAFGRIILGDFDGDGKTDIIVGAGTAVALTGPSVMVFLAGGASTFGGPPVSLVSGLNSTNRQAYSHVAADFNGDGFPDLLVQDFTEMNVLTGVGDGSFRETFHYVPATGYVTSIATADFNQDGKLDIVVTIYNPPTARMLVFLGNGDGSFQAPLSSPSPCCFSKITVADFNGDGKPDVAVLLSNQEGVAPVQLLIYLGTGDGTFAAPLASSVGAYPAALVVGDFNGDGKPDLVIADRGQLQFGVFTGSGLSILLGNGDGTFSVPISIPVGADNPHPIGLVAADWNRDGLLDLAVTLPGQLLVLLGRGDGTFQVSTAHSVLATNFDKPVVADLNGDGIPDLIGAGPRWLLGNGDGTFGPEVTFSGGLAGLYLGAIIAADFNQDGRTDLAGGVTLGVAVLLNISQAASSTTVRF